MPKLEDEDFTKKIETDRLMSYDEYHDHFNKTISGDEQKETILEQAQRLIYGARPAEYDHPRNDFTRTGRIWGAILTGHLGYEIPDIPPEIVGLMMVGVKVSRESYKHKEDNTLDGAGYFGCIERVLDNSDKEVTKDANG
jgi:hypothetical protein